MAKIISLNRWSGEERLNWAEKIITHAFKTVDALGFRIGTDDSTGKRLIGIGARKEGFDLPTVLMEGQQLVSETSQLLKQLGFENKEKA